MTFDERLYEILLELDHKLVREPRHDIARDHRLEAITAIKQAMRETMPVKKRDVVQDEEGNWYLPAHSEVFNTAIDEIEKGFGL